MLHAVKKHVQLKCSFNNRIHGKFVSAIKWEINNGDLQNFRTLLQQ